VYNNECRFSKDRDAITLLIKGESSETFEQCFSFRDPLLQFEGFIALSSGNSNEQKQNDINLYSLKVYNNDPNSYTSLDLKDTLGVINAGSKTSEDVLRGYTNKNKKSNKWVGEMHKIKETDEEQVIVQKLHELQKVYSMNLRSFMTEFSSMNSNSEQVISFTKERVLDLGKTYQDIEVKVQNVINERFKKMNSNDQNDFNKVFLFKNDLIFIALIGYQNC